jgi:hypothetical protein
MKLYLLMFSILLNFSTLLGQEIYNNEFQKIYNQIAFNQGRYKKNDLMIKKWNQDIKIYFEGDSLDYLKAATDSLIQKLSPCLNKLRINTVSKKVDANYLIKVIDTSYTYYDQSGYYESWTSRGSIYRCIYVINRVTTFNRIEHIKLLRSDFMKSLGFFTFNKVNTSVNSCMFDHLIDITDFDCEVLRLHYSDDIKSGMSKKDVKDFFRMHK